MKAATVPLMMILGIGTAVVTTGALGSEPPEDDKTAVEKPVATAAAAADETK